MRRMTHGSNSVLTVLVAMAATFGFLLAGTAVPAQAAATRIMALGDSITGSPGCWRAMLWNRLANTGHTNIDFVGTLPPQGCGLAYDGENEGHGGALATNVADQNQLPGWLSATRPDIVMMHFGTNDVWSNRPTATILAAYGKLVDQMRASNPDMKILVAKIIPMNPSTCAECGQRVSALNDAIPGWAAAKTTARSPVVVVDQWTGFSTASDTYDGVHPNAAGDQKMSDRWYPALTALLDRGDRPTVPPTPPVTPTPTPTPTVTPPAGGCTAVYRITDQWSGGFQGEVTVSNAGAAPITAWATSWTFAGRQISQAWNATLTQTGAAVTARNAAWNGSLAPGRPRPSASSPPEPAPPHPRSPARPARAASGRVKPQGAEGRAPTGTSPEKLHAEDDTLLTGRRPSHSGIADALLERVVPAKNKVHRAHTAFDLPFPVALQREMDQALARHLRLVRSYGMLSKEDGAADGAASRARPAGPGWSACAAPARTADTGRDHQGSGR